MALHQESAEKRGIRKLLLDACKELGRSPLTYMGLPAEEARDIIALQSVLDSAICIAPNPATLVETARSISAIPLRNFVPHSGDVWEYLRDDYDEHMLADITYLDFLWWRHST